MTLGPDEKSRRTADLVGVAAWAGGEFRRSGKLLVRRADGFTDRANGAVALDSLDEHEAAQLVDEASAAARADDVVDRWQVSDHETPLAAVLEGRGAVFGSPTFVMTRVAPAEPGPGAATDPPLAVDGAVSAAWFDVWLEGNGRRQREDPSWVQTARRFFERLPAAVPEARFVHTDGAVGLGVTVGGRFGEPTAHYVGCMATRPELRGRGLGSAVLRAACGDGLTVLQVEEGNPAIELYRRAGFEVSHRYHHVQLPAV